jgi:hypothetical protein
MMVGCWYGRTTEGVMGMGVRRIDRTTALAAAVVLAAE